MIGDSKVGITFATANKLDSSRNTTRIYGIRRYELINAQILCATSKSSSPWMMICSFRLIILCRDE